MAARARARSLSRRRPSEPATLSPPSPPPRSALQVWDVLSERAPRDVELSALRRALASVPGVEMLRCLHVWSLGPGKHALACHVKIAAPPADAAADDDDALTADDVLSDLRAVCRYRFGLYHTTFQVSSDEGLFV